MKKSVAVLASLAALLLAVSVQAAPAFVGKWNVVAQERKGERRDTPAERKPVIDFQRDGKLVLSMTMTHEGKTKTKTREGTWKLTGKKIVTVVEGRTEEMTFEVTGKKLKLTNPARAGEIMYLERAR